MGRSHTFLSHNTKYVFEEHVSLTSAAWYCVDGGLHESIVKPSILYSELCIRVCHLQFFLISLLFQAGIYPRHTKEQEKYRSYMVYVYIFQRFLTFVLYNYTLQLQGKNGQNKPENPQN